MLASKIFIHTAERWCTKNFGFTPDVGDLRGSVVQSYYAVFHRAAEICAETLVGSRTENVQSSSAWNEFYRNLRHDTIRDACVHKSRNRFSEQVQGFFKWFPVLKEARNLCSYEALVEPTMVQTQLVLSTAKGCIDCLNNIDKSESADFVAFIMLKPSGGVGQVRGRNFDDETSFFDKFKAKF